MLQVILVNLLISRKVEGTTWGQRKDSSYKLQELLIIRHLAFSAAGTKTVGQLVR